MKVLEHQSALLSNFEVLDHVNATRATPRSAPSKHENVETVLKETSDYLSPHSSQNDSSSTALPSYVAPNYSTSSIPHLLQRLKPYVYSKEKPEGLYKQEVLMIVNLRPRDLALLDCIIEECDERFTEQEQEKILEIVGEVLGGEGEEEVNGHAEANEQSPEDGEEDTDAQMGGT